MGQRRSAAVTDAEMKRSAHRNAVVLGVPHERVPQLVALEVDGEANRDEELCAAVSGRREAVRVAAVACV